MLAPRYFSIYQKMLTFTPVTDFQIQLLGRVTQTQQNQKTKKLKIVEFQQQTTHWFCSTASVVACGVLGGSEHLWESLWASVGLCGALGAPKHFKQTEDFKNMRSNIRLNNSLTYQGPHPSHSKAKHDTPKKCFAAGGNLDGANWWYDAHRDGRQKFRRGRTPGRAADETTLTGAGGRSLKRKKPTHTGAGGCRDDAHRDGRQKFKGEMFFKVIGGHKRRALGRAAL